VDQPLILPFSGAPKPTDGRALPPVLSPVPQAEPNTFDRLVAEWTSALREQVEQYERPGPPGTTLAAQETRTTHLSRRSSGTLLAILATVSEGSLWFGLVMAAALFGARVG
jgi:hypothetical protein